MSIRRTRIVTGLVLFTYLTTHLLNHSLGLISLDAMEAGREWFLALWRNPLSTALLYGSLLTHFTLALYALYQRRHPRIPFWEALQLTLGLCIPILLAAHFVSTRMAYEWYGVEDLYTKIVLTLWRVGIHCGPAVVGRMGYGEMVHVTAIGDAVNVASRLQDLTKQYGCQLIVSDEVAKRAQLNAGDFPRHELTVRNRREALAIFVVENVQQLDNAARERDR